MKTPKVKTDKPNSKFSKPLGGKVKKSVSKKDVDSIKNAGKALKELIKDDLSDIKVKNLKNKKPAGKGVAKNEPVEASTKIGSPLNKKKDQNGIAPQGKSPNQKKKGKGKAKQLNNSPVNSSSPENLITEGLQRNKSKKSPKSEGSTNDASGDSENNSSPVKINKENKKGKPSFAFNIDDSLSTPNTKLPKGKGGKSSPAKPQNSSPEVELGLKLEEALSPKSKKARKKRGKGKLQTEGKVEVSKKDSLKISNPAEGEKPLKKRKKRRGKKSAAPAASEEPSLFQTVNAKNALTALHKILNSEKSKKKELFDEDQYIYLQINLVKHAPTAKGVLHVALPHLIFPGIPDVCLISADLKGKRNDPDEAIDFYKDLLKKQKIDSVSEIIPIRKLKKEYSQFEERLKLANRFDIILVDGRVGKLARVGRRFAKTKKSVNSVKFGAKDLKAEFERGLRKVALFSSGKGNSYSIKCGRIGMNEKEICENIIDIGKALANDRMIVGDKRNVSSVFVKTATSESFPVYVSTVSPNEVPEPEGKKRPTEKPVRGEVTTVQGADVIVYPSGVVKVKKRKNEAEDSDEEDKSTNAKNKTKKAKASQKDSKKTENKLAKTKGDEDSDSIPSDEGESDDFEDDSDRELDSDEEIRRLKANMEFFSGSEDDSEFEDGDESDDEEDDGSDDDGDESDKENTENEDVSDSDEDKIVKSTTKKSPVVSPAGQKKKNKNNKGLGVKSPSPPPKKGPAQKGPKAAPKKGPAQNSPKGPQNKKAAQNTPKQPQNKNAAGPKKQTFNNKGKNVNKFKGKGKAQ